MFAPSKLRAKISSFHTRNLPKSRNCEVNLFSKFFITLFGMRSLDVLSLLLIIAGDIEVNPGPTDYGKCIFIDY